MINISLDDNELLIVYESLLKSLKDDDHNVVIRKFRKILLSAMSKDSLQSQLHSSRCIINEEKFKIWESQEAKKIKDLEDVNKNSISQLSNLTSSVKKRKTRG